MGLHSDINILSGQNTNYLLLLQCILSKVLEFLKYTQALLSHTWSSGSPGIEEVGGIPGLGLAFSMMALRATRPGCWRCWDMVQVVAEFLILRQDKVLDWKREMNRRNLRETMICPRGEICWHGTRSGDVVKAWKCQEGGAPVKNQVYKQNRLHLTSHSNWWCNFFFLFTILLSLNHSNSDRVWCWYINFSVITQAYSHTGFEYRQ